MMHSDKARGCFLGLAVGDALGAPLEFTARDSNPIIKDMVGGGFHGVQPGQWTDDTAMALALADGLIAKGCLSDRDVLTRFLSWLDTGAYSCTGTCFDIGNATLSSLNAFRKEGKACPEVVSSGNGSLMRMAPAVLFANNLSQAVQLASDQSLLTHGSVQAVESCQFFAELLWDALSGLPKDQVLRPRAWSGDPAIAKIAAGEWRSKQRKSISSSGYVVHTMEAAMWCLDQTNSFEDALILAVNLGDDADTVGAVAGQLAGALYGASGIPDRWLQPLAWKDRIQKTADQLIGS